MPSDSVHINNRAVKQNTYDAIVVGSGISGGWAAKELCEKGLKTLVLERGRRVRHIKDYTDTTKNPWELPHRNFKTTEDKLTNPVQSQIYAYDEVSRHFFVNDKEHPYTQVKPFNWIRGYQEGGRSLVWGRMCFRLSDLDFTSGFNNSNWPIRYKDIEAWYGMIERYIGVSGSIDNIPHLPDGEYIPAMEMNCVELDIKNKLQHLYGNERKLIIGRVANLTKPLDNRGPCQYRNKCHQGCPYGGYFSSNSSTLPAAERTGNMIFRPDAIVTEVIYDKEKKRAKGIRIIDAETMQTEEYFAPVIFLNASTINTTSILLQSTSDVFPGGLGNTSGQVGHNLMTHHVGVGAGGTVEGFEDKYYSGRRPAVCYIPRFNNLDTKASKKNYTGGFAFQTGSWRQGWNRNMDNVPIGVTLKESISEPGNWMFSLEGFAEMLPYYDNTVSLDKNKKDKWGLPTVTIDCGLKENELAMRKDILSTAEELMHQLGLKNIYSYNNTGINNERLYSTHEMGTARMGTDPKTSVLNFNNQLHDVPNVFITDGACMATSACQNPSLTYMALTARACDFAVRTLKKGDL